MIKDNDTQSTIHKGFTIKCLDHGYVTVRNWMGDAAEICNAARLSYGEGTKSYSDDVNLIRYLLRHAHTSPFEMAVLQVEIKLPIFVARQLVRHRMSSLNEYSLRYSEATDEMYIPKPEHLGRQAKNNKQGRSSESLDEFEAKLIQQIIQENGESSFTNYNFLLGKIPATATRDGKEETFNLEIARELARMVLPVNAYTKWVWKVDANNLIKILKLRQDKHAQYEIRVYADALAHILAIWMPEVYNAYVDYVRDAVTLSVQQMQAIKYATSTYSNSSRISFFDHLKNLGKPVDMSKREFDDLLVAFGEET